MSTAPFVRHGPEAGQANVIKGVATALSPSITYELSSSITKDESLFKKNLSVTQTVSITVRLLKVVCITGGNCMEGNDNFFAFISTAHGGVQHRDWHVSRLSTLSMYVATLTCPYLSK